MVVKVHPKTTSRYKETDKDRIALMPNLSASGPQTRRNRMLDA